MQRARTALVAAVAPRAAAAPPSASRGGAAVTRLELDAGVRPQLLPDGVVDQQIDDDRVAGPRRIGERDAAHEQVRVLRRRRSAERGGAEYASTPENPAQSIQAGHVARRIEVRPRPGGRTDPCGLRIADRGLRMRTRMRIADCGLGRRSAGRAAGAIDRHDRDRHVGVLAAGVGLPARDDAGHVAPAGALNLERRALREEARLIGERAQPALHQVRAEVVEQQEAAEQEERDEQQRRHEADEDVGEDQLAPDAPQQAPLREHDQPGGEVGERRPPRRGPPPCRRRATNGRDAARAPRASRIRNTPSLIARPTTIARPGSVWSSAPRHARRADRQRRAAAAAAALVGRSGSSWTSRY